jgi:hypothetical protein
MEFGQPILSKASMFKPFENKAPRTAAEPKPREPERQGRASLQELAANQQDDS